MCVLAWGYHSSIFVEQPPDGRFGPVGDEDARYVEYGWGDRRYYMESNFAPQVLFASATLPTASVVYVCGHAGPPEDEVVGGEVFVRECDGAEVLRLLTVLEQQMVREPDGSRPPAFAATPEYPGRFYPGREPYVLWWNCNMWTVRMLSDAGFDAHPELVVSPWQIGRSVRGFQRAASRKA